MFETLFGSEMPLAARFFIAFLVVLALIGLTAWLVRRFGANRLGGANARGRQPRLAVIDAATVDGRRRLVLIRRDNIEHLLMIGGPTDVVVEPISCARPARAKSRASRRASPMPRDTLRAPPAAGRKRLAAAAANEPAPIPPPRPYRAHRDRRAVAAAGARRAARPPSGRQPHRPCRRIVTRASIRPDTPPPARSRAAAARQRASAPPPSRPPPPQTDHNLAEMAQQLEAALRRAPAPESRPPVTDPLAVPRRQAARRRATQAARRAEIRTAVEPASQA